MKFFQYLLHSFLALGVLVVVCKTLVSMGVLHHSWLTPWRWFNIG